MKGKLLDILLIIIAAVLVIAAVILQKRVHEEIKNDYKKTLYIK